MSEWILCRYQRFGFCDLLGTPYFYVYNLGLQLTNLFIQVVLNVQCVQSITSVMTLLLK